MSAVGNPVSLRNRFVGDENGSMTIEFVLWIPIIMALLATAIDATMLYVTHTEMANVARDTARRMVTGIVRSESDAEEYAANAMSLRNAPYAVKATYDEDSVVEVKIAIAFGDMSIIGYGSPLAIFGKTIAAHAIMRPDPRLPFIHSDGNGGGNNS